MVHSLGLVGIGSITLGTLSFLCMVAGIFLVWVPFLGAMLGFLAPVLALLGIVLGGVALSRAREGGHENENLAIGGLITSIVAFVPSTLVAITCSMCSACWTGLVLTPPTDTGPRAVFPDAGPSTWGAPPAWPAPPGTMPPGTMPPGTMPPGTMPPGTMPTTPGTVPPGTMPTTPGTVPPGTMPTVPTPPGATTPSTDPPPSEEGTPSVEGTPSLEGTPALPPPPLPPGPNVRSH